MANAEMVRIHTYNTKEETKMKNEAMNVRNQLPGGGFHRDEQQSDPSEGWQKVTLLLENGERADVLIRNAQAVCLVLEDGQEAPKVLCNGQLVPSPGGMFR